MTTIGIRAPHSATTTREHAGLAGLHDRLSDVGLLILRLLPLVMMTHGIHKATGFSGFEKTVAANSFGAMAPMLFSVMIVLGQIFLPLFVASGLLTRLAAGLEAFMMFMVWLTMFAVKGLVDQKTGGPAGESALLYVFMLLPLVFTGAGRYSVDQWWTSRRAARNAE